MRWSIAQYSENQEFTTELKYLHTALNEAFRATELYIQELLMLCHVCFTTMQNYKSKFSLCSVGLSGESYFNFNSQTLGTPNFQCQKIKSSLQAAKSVSTKIFGSKFFTKKFYTNRIILQHHFYQMIFTIAHIFPIQSYLFLFIY